MRWWFRDGLLSGSHYGFRSSYRYHLGMSMKQKRDSRRNTLVACAIGAAMAVGSFMVGQVFKPRDSAGMSLLLARIQTPPPPYPPDFPDAKVVTAMYKNDIFLRKFVGNSGEGLFKTAYDCNIHTFTWEPISVNYSFSVEEVLIVPLDRLNQKQSHCISRVAVPPNVTISVASEHDLPKAIRQIVSRNPLVDWD